MCIYISFTHCFLRKQEALYLGTLLRYIFGDCLLVSQTGLAALFSLLASRFATLLFKKQGEASVVSETFQLGNVVSFLDLTIRSVYFASGEFSETHCYIEDGSDLEVLTYTKCAHETLH